MKTISNVAGYIRCGHLAIKTEGLTSVEVPESRSKILGRMVSRRCSLGELDRCVSIKEFVDVTGLTVISGGVAVKPVKKTHSVAQIAVTQLIKL